MGSTKNPVFLAIFSVAAVLAMLGLGGDPRAARLLLNTALLAVLVTALALPLGTALALVLMRTDVPGRWPMTVLLGGLFMVPLYLQTAGWQAGFALQGWFTLEVGGAVWLSGWRAAVWVHTVAAVPWVTAIVAAGIAHVEPALEEAALLDAAPAAVLWQVTIRRAIGAIAAAAAWCCAWTAGEMTVTDMFQLRTYAEELYTQLALGSELAELPLLVAPGVAVWALLVAGLWLACDRLVPQLRSAAPSGAVRFACGPWRWPLALSIAAVVALCIGLPLASLVWKAGVAVTQTPLGRERTWSLVRCLEVVGASPWRFRQEWLGTLTVTLPASLAAVAAALPLACLARQRRGGRLALVTVVALLAALPAPLLAIAIIFLANRPGIAWLVWLYDRTVFAPVAAQFLRALPWTTLVAWFTLRSVPANLLEAAELHGAGLWTRLFRIVLPYRWPAIAVAWLVAWAICLGDLAASILVAPPGLTTLSIRIFGLLHYGVEDQVAGISLTLFALFQLLAAAVLLVGFALRRQA